MALTAGLRLGPYEIVSAIGAGGMREVYRPTDTRLNRTVAIKVLPPDLALDVERRQRFAREARLVASLNHPHSQRSTRGDYDIHALHLTDGTVVPLRDSTFNETDTRFSPDGRHVAFVSNEGGKNNVYVMPFHLLFMGMQPLTIVVNWPASVDR